MSTTGDTDDDRPDTTVLSPVATQVASPRRTGIGINGNGISVDRIQLQSPLKSFSPLSAIPESQSASASAALSSTTPEHAIEMADPEDQQQPPSHPNPTPTEHDTRDLTQTDTLNTNIHETMHTHQTPHPHPHPHTPAAVVPRSRVGLMTPSPSGGRSSILAVTNTPTSPLTLGISAATLGIVGRAATSGAAMHTATPQQTHAAYGASSALTRQPSAPNTPAQMAANRGAMQMAQANISRSAQNSPHHPLPLPYSQVGPASASRRRPSVSLLAGLPAAASAGVGGAATVDDTDHTGPTTLEPPGMRPDAMISYSRRDIQFVKHLCQFFEHAGRTVWIDFRCIPKSVDFMAAIDNGIRDSNSFIYVLSPDSVASKYCDAELDAAIKYGKRIIPIVIRDVEPATVRAEIQSINWIFCTPQNGSATAAGTVAATAPSSSLLNGLWDVFPHILESVLVDPAYVGMHTRILIRALEWEHNNEDSSFLATGRELEEANKWMAKSRVYAAQQLSGGASRRSSLLHPPAGVGRPIAPLPPPAPLPTRIQRLFVFASNERVADSRRKEQLLQKFLEEDVEVHEDEDEEEEEEVDEEQNEIQQIDQHNDGNNSEQAGQIDANERAQTQYTHTHPNQSSPLKRPTTPEHGSLAPPHTKTPHTSPAVGSLAPVVVGRPSSSSGSLIGGGAVPVKSTRRSSTGRRRSTTTHLHVSGHTPRLLHLGPSSNYAHFHKNQLRELLQRRNRIMRDLMKGKETKTNNNNNTNAHVSPADSTDVKPVSTVDVVDKVDLLVVNVDGSCAPHAAPHHHAALTAAPTDPPPPTPPTAPQAHGQQKGTIFSFDALRLRLYTLHESRIFFNAFRWFMLFEGAMIFIALILALNVVFDEPNRSIDGLDALRIILITTHACFLLELLTLLIIIRDIFHDVRLFMQRETNYIIIAGLLFTITIIDGIGWKCRGVQIDGLTGGPLSSHECRGNLLLWSLIVRIVYLCFRWSAFTVTPYLHAIHSFHSSLLHSRSTISKLKQMVSILNGEILQTENANRMKWERLKNFHPSRRFTKVNGDTGFNGAAGVGASTGGLAAGSIGSALAPPSAAELSHAASLPTPFRAAAARMAKSTAARTLPTSTSHSSPRRATMLPMLSPAASSMAANRTLISPRYSTFQPARVGDGTMMITPKRVSHAGTPSGTPRLVLSTPIQLHVNLAGAASDGGIGRSSASPSSIMSPIPIMRGTPSRASTGGETGFTDAHGDNSGPPLSLEQNGVLLTPMLKCGSGVSGVVGHSRRPSDQPPIVNAAHAHESPASTLDDSDGAITLHIRSESGRMEQIIQRLQNESTSADDLCEDLNPDVGDGEDDDDDDDGDDDDDDDVDPSDLDPDEVGDESGDDENTAAAFANDALADRDFLSPAINAAGPRGSIAAMQFIITQPTQTGPDRRTLRSAHIDIDIDLAAPPHAPLSHASGPTPPLASDAPPTRPTVGQVVTLTSPATFSPRTEPSPPPDALNKPNA